MLPSDIRKNLNSINYRGSQPISRVLSGTVIHLDHSSPNNSSNLPELNAGRINEFLFGLAPSGVFPAITVTSYAVRSYRTISPLPSPMLTQRLWRYIFCGTFRRFTSPRCYLALCPVEPGLSSPRRSVKRLPWPTPCNHHSNYVYMNAT